MRLVSQSVLAAAFSVPASVASASQWWTDSAGPRADCQVANFDHGHSPAEWFEYESTLGGDPEILDNKEYPGVVGVEFTNSGGRRRVIAFFRTIELCEVFLESARHNLDQYR
jgi:hypothetical protein